MLLKLFFVWGESGKKRGEVTLQPALANRHPTDISLESGNTFLKGQFTGRGGSKAAQVHSPLAKSHNRNAVGVKSKHDFRDLY